MIEEGESMLIRRVRLYLKISAIGHDLEEGTTSPSIAGRHHARTLKPRESTTAQRRKANPKNYKQKVRYTSQGSRDRT